MSSNIKLQRICQHCDNEFTARTTTTLYCSHRCNSAAYKAKVREGKIEAINTETQRIKTQPIEMLKAKEFLTVRDVATLLNCSVRTVYYYIDNGNIEAINLGQRITRVKRSAIDKLFDKPQSQELDSKQIHYEISECYNLTEVQARFGISESALQNLIKRHEIPKIRKGWFAYVPKIEIEKLLS